MKKILKKLLSLLRVLPIIAGLEVGDRIIRLMRFDGKVWQMHAIRIGPGVMENGKILDRGALIAVFGALKDKLGAKDRAKKINVIACLSSVQTYTQVFSLPIVQGESFDRAVELNLQMASPLEAGEAHSGWQILGRDTNTMKTEVLSMFVERTVVDEMADALFEAGFLAVAVETRALALTRVLREQGAGIDPGKVYLFLSIDNSGLNFLIIRNGSLYFEYTNLWRDLMDDKGEITVPKFEAALAASLQRVMNFYSQHWTESLSAVILSAVTLGEQAERVVAANSTAPVVRLTLVMGQPISSEWLVALGCSLQGASLREKEHGISLLGEDSQDRFHEEQLIHFMRFWRVLVPVALSILVVTFVVADSFLVNTRVQIESRSDLNLGGAQTTEIANLQSSAETFNRAIALVASAEGMQNPKGPLLDAVLGIAKANNVTISHLTFQAFNAPISLSGSGPSQDSVVAFKVALAKDPRFSAVNLPLTAVQTQGATVVFSMTFVFAPAPAASQ